MSLRDDINIPVISILGITTGLIVAVAIVGTHAGYNYVTQVDLARNYQTAEDRGILHYGKNILDKQSAQLEQPAAWTEVDKSAVRIPINDARRIMIESKGKAKSAQPPATQPESQKKK